MTNTRDRRYRVNYGNGQVSERCTMAEARELLDAETTYPEYACIQRYEPGTADQPGDWVTVMFPVSRS